MDYKLIKSFKKLFAIIVIGLFVFDFAFAADQDIGIRFRDDGHDIPVAVKPAASSSSPLMIRKDNTTYGIELVAINDPLATNMRIMTDEGEKAIKKYVAEPVYLIFNDLCSTSGSCPGYANVWVKNKDCVYAKKPDSSYVLLGCNRNGSPRYSLTDVISVLGFSQNPANNILSLKMVSDIGKTITTTSNASQWNVRKITNGYVIATNNNSDGQWRDLYFSLTLPSSEYSFELENYSSMTKRSASAMPSNDLSP